MRSSATILAAAYAPLRRVLWPLASSRRRSRKRSPPPRVIGWSCSPSPWPSSATPIGWSSPRRRARSRPSSASPASRWVGSFPSFPSPTRLRDSRGMDGRPLGGQVVLLRVVSLWSFFTAATGWVWSYLSLLACRFFFGVGEAGASPISRRRSPTGFPAGSGCAPRASCGSPLAGEAPSPPPSWLCSFSTCPGGGFRAVRPPRYRVGSVLLLLVPRRAEGPPEGECGRAVSHPAGGIRLRRSRAHAVAPHPRQPLRPPALAPVLPAQLRLVVLHPVAPHLPEGSTRLRPPEGRGDGRRPRGGSPLPRRHRVLAAATCSRAGPPFRRGRAHTPGHRPVWPGSGRAGSSSPSSSRIPCGPWWPWASPALPTISPSPFRGRRAWTWAVGTPAPLPAA